MNKAAMTMFAPLGLSLGAMGYALWPYLGEDEQAAAKKAAITPIESRLLDPEIPPARGRNPFLSAEQLGRIAKAAPVKAAAKAAAQPLTESRPAALPLPEGRLGAVILGGGKRSAIINGRVYQVGEPVKDVGAGRWKLAKVEPERIFLENLDDGRTAPLRFGERPKTANTKTKAGTRTAAAAANPGLPPGVELSAETLLNRGPLEQLAADSGGDFTKAYASLLKLAIDGGAKPAAVGGGPDIPVD